MSAAEARATSDAHERHAGTRGPLSRTGRCRPRPTCGRLFACDSDCVRAFRPPRLRASLKGSRSRSCRRHEAVRPLVASRCAHVWNGRPAADRLTSGRRAAHRRAGQQDRGSTPRASITQPSADRRVGADVTVGQQRRGADDRGTAEAVFARLSRRLCHDGPPQAVDLRVDELSWNGRALCRGLSRWASEHVSRRRCSFHQPGRCAARPGARVHEGTGSRR